MFLLDTKGKVRLVNEASDKVIGYSKQELEDTFISDYIHPDDWELLNQKWLLRCNDENLEKAGVEFRMRQKDNTFISVYSCVSTVCWDNEIIGMFIIAMTDLSYKEHFKAKLLEAENRLKSITDTLEIMIWSVDIETEKIVYMSTSVEKVFGISAAEMYKHPTRWLDIIHPEDKHSWYAEEIDNQAELYNREYRIFRPDGTIRWIKERINPYYEDNKLVRIDGVSFDSTEQKKTFELMSNVQRVGKIGDWVYKIKTSEVKLSKELSNLFGLPDTETEFKPIDMFWNIVHPEDLVFVKDSVMSAIVERIPIDIEFRVIDPIGKIKYFQSQGYVISNANDEPIEMIGTAKDITERKRTEVQFQKLVEHSFDVIAILSSAGYFNYISSTVKKALGYDPNEVIGSSMLEYIDPEIHDEVMSYFHKILEKPNESVRLEIRIRHQNGGLLDFEIIGTNLLDVWGINGVVLNYRDITEKKKADQMINYLAFHDPLTRLPNRIYITKALKGMIGQEKLFSLMFIDLDRFKVINDTAGHPIGDLALVEIAKRLTNCVGKEDLVARLGGDEFLCVLKNTSKEGTKQIAERLIKIFEDPIQIHNKNYFITTSIGITGYPSDGDTVDTLIKKADTAMYVVKQEGKNNFSFFHPDMERDLQEKTIIEQELREAIVQKEFSLHYQPKINTNANRICGFEALIRWKYPPDVFIPIAEESGLIIEVGRWVLKEGITQLQKWHQAGFNDLHLSVNVANCQLNDPSFLDQLRDYLHDSGLNPSFLELEITETTAIINAEETIKLFSKLKAIGVKIAIDDFGKGFSSLSYLQDFTFDNLKIDKSFIQKIGNSSKTKYIIQSVLTLARALNVRVVAEGVETQEQFQFLKEHGCDECQGYYFARPLPLNEVEGLLKNM